MQPREIQDCLTNCPACSSCGRQRGSGCSRSRGRGTSRRAWIGGRWARVSSGFSAAVSVMIVGAEPVRAPLPHVAAHIDQAETVGLAVGAGTGPAAAIPPPVHSGTTLARRCSAARRLASGRRPRESGCLRGRRAPRIPIRLRSAGARPPRRNRPGHRSRRCARRDGPGARRCASPVLRAAAMTHRRRRATRACPAPPAGCVCAARRAPADRRRTKSRGARHRSRSVWRARNRRTARLVTAVAAIEKPTSETRRTGPSPSAGTASAPSFPIVNVQAPIGIRCRRARPGSAPSDRCAAGSAAPDPVWPGRSRPPALTPGLSPRRRG